MKPEQQHDHDQGASMERVERGVEPERKDRPESDQSAAEEDSPEQAQSSEQVQGDSVERVEDGADPEQRDLPESERSAEVEAGHEIAR